MAADDYYVPYRVYVAPLDETAAWSIELVTADGLIRLAVQRENEPTVADIWEAYERHQRGLRPLGIV